MTTKSEKLFEKHSPKASGASVRSILESDLSTSYTVMWLASAILSKSTVILPSLANCMMRFLSVMHF